MSGEGIARQRLEIVRGFKESVEDFKKSLDTVTHEEIMQFVSPEGPVYQAGTLSGAGREPLIVGTAFSMAENEVSELLKGQNGVYKIKVTQSSKAAPIENYMFFTNQQQEKYRANILSKVFTALKDSKEVIDNRAEYY